LVLVSYLYFSIRSLSPENQPSSLPPDLTPLVLTLFEVGGVDSLMAEKKTEKSLLHRFCKRCCNWLFLRKRSATTDFIKVIESNHSMICVGTRFSEREDLTLPCTENVRKS